MRRTLDPNPGCFHSPMQKVIYITALADPLVDKVRAAAAGRIDLFVVSGDEAPESLNGFDAVLIGDGRLRLPLSAFGQNGPKLVQLTRAHHLDVDAAALALSGVTVAGASPVLAPFVARHALALALGARQQQRPAVLQSRDELTAVVERAGPSLDGLTVGVVGFGRIGAAMAGLCAGFGAKVIYSDIRTAARSATAVAGLRRSTLDLLLSQSDVVTLHVQWGPTSDPLLTERELRLIGPESVLVNTADARLVDAEALIAFLRSGRVVGAGLDIEESAAAQFVDVPGALLTPYVSARSTEADDAVAPFVVDNIETALSGGEPAGVVEIVDFPRAGDPAFWSSKMAPRVAGGTVLASRPHA